MGKFKIRPMFEAPRDGSFVCVVDEDGAGCVTLRFKDYQWLDVAGHPYSDDQEISARFWFWPPKQWLVAIIAHLVNYNDELYSKLYAADPTP